MAHNISLYFNKNIGQKTSDTSIRLCFLVPKPIEISLSIEIERDADLLSTNALDSSPSFSTIDPFVEYLSITYDRYKEHPFN